MITKTDVAESWAPFIRTDMRQLPALAAISASVPAMVLTAFSIDNIANAAGSDWIIASVLGLIDIVLIAMVVIVCRFARKRI